MATVTSSQHAEVFQRMLDYRNERDAALAELRRIRERATLLERAGVMLRETVDEKDARLLRIAAVMDWSTLTPIQRLVEVRRLVDDDT